MAVVVKMVIFLMPLVMVVNAYLATIVARYVQQRDVQSVDIMEVKICSLILIKVTHASNADLTAKVAMLSEDALSVKILVSTTVPLARLVLISVLLAVSLVVATLVMILPSSPSTRSAILAELAAQPALLLENATLAKLLMSTPTLLPRPVKSVLWDAAPAVLLLSVLLVEQDISPVAQSAP